MILAQIIILLALLGSPALGLFLFGRGGKEEYEEDRLFNSGEYGVDASYPIHYPLNPRSERGKYYQGLMDGCYKMYSKAECDATERGRLDMNRKQPKAQHNYTETGFKKMRLPEHIWGRLLEFYNLHANNSKPENWGGRGNSYVNHWESPTTMVSFEDRDFPGGAALKQYIWDNVQPIIEEWVGRKVHPTSLYGIRVYSDGAMLATHVDRLPLVSSCIIQVSQDVDEPWPIEVISHAGKAYNVTMQPGDLVLYESHTVLHGRPFQLKGRHYANVFVHYEPEDHAQMNKLDREPNKHLDRDGLEELHRKTGNENIGGHEAINQDSVGSEEEAEEEDIGQTPAHEAARDGDLDALVKLLRQDQTQVNVADKNGWLPIHEAARGGHLATLQYLIQVGADIGAMTKYGGTPLWWAKRSLPAGHGVISFLEDIGAPEKAERDGYATEF